MRGIRRRSILARWSAVPSPAFALSSVLTSKRTPARLSRRANCAEFAEGARFVPRGAGRLHSRRSGSDAERPAAGEFSPGCRSCQRALIRKLNLKNGQIGNLPHGGRFGASCAQTPRAAAQRAASRLTTLAKTMHYGYIVSAFASEVPRVEARTKVWSLDCHPEIP